MESSTLLLLVLPSVMSCPGQGSNNSCVCRARMSSTPPTPYKLPHPHSHSPGNFSQGTLTLCIPCWQTLDCLHSRVSACNEYKEKRPALLPDQQVHLRPWKMGTASPFRSKGTRVYKLAPQRWHPLRKQRMAWPLASVGMEIATRVLTNDTRPAWSHVKEVYCNGRDKEG